MFIVPLLWLVLSAQSSDCRRHRLKGFRSGSLRRTEPIGAPSSLDPTTEPRRTVYLCSSVQMMEFETPQGMRGRSDRRQSSKDEDQSGISRSKLKPPPSSTFDLHTSSSSRTSMSSSMTPLDRCKAEKVSPITQGSGGNGGSDWGTGGARSTFDFSAKISWAAVLAVLACVFGGTIAL